VEKEGRGLSGATNQDRRTGGGRGVRGGKPVKKKICRGKRNSQLLHKTLDQRKGEFEKNLGGETSTERSPVLAGMA